jgi:aspartyl aminopeptidase
MTTANRYVRQLINFIDTSPSPCHAVQSMEAQLAAFQFIRLYEADKWQLQTGGRYYVVRDDSSLIAFMVGQQPLVETGFKLVGGHTDSPSLRIKPNPAIVTDGLLRLSVEIYGGPILATFTDRDLSLAGRVSYKDEDGEINSRLVRYNKPLLRLPNLAIHMNRNVNEDGLKLHKQQELPLILTSLTEQQLPADYFTDWLQQQLDVEVEQILAWDLTVYDTQKGVLWGADNEFYADSQLDNLASCHAALTALLDEKVLAANNTLVCAFFDHEEIGSESHKGADGSFLADVLKRIALASGTDSEDFLRALAKSFMISADMAHAYQPSFPAAYDADHKVLMNQGPVIKINANQRYSTHSGSEAIFADCCDLAGVPYQKYSHRNDLGCGSTVGPMLSSQLGISCVDVGNPLWAMHSIRESAGVWDHYYLIKALRQFFAR